MEIKGNKLFLSIHDLDVLEQYSNSRSDDDLDLWVGQLISKYIFGRLEDGSVANLHRNTIEVPYSNKIIDTMNTAFTLYIETAPQRELIDAQIEAQQEVSPRQRAREISLQIRNSPNVIRFPHKNS